MRRLNNGDSIDRNCIDYARNGIAIGRLIVLVVTFSFTPASAKQYATPSDHADLVGERFVTYATGDESLLLIARRYDLGRNDIELANPEVSLWLPLEGEAVVIPAQFVLPQAKREGIVINLPELRLYHFNRTNTGTPAQLATYPVSIGRLDWQTPLGSSVIVRKRENPAWVPPESIRQEAALEGRILPERIEPGPNNPLGDYALSLSIPGYLLHGTNKPLGIGMRVTHGCIRLLPEDINALYHAVDVGTPVEIVNQPVKMGWLGDDLYLEVHPPLPEDNLSNDALLQIAVQQLHRALREGPHSGGAVKVRSSLVRQVVNRQDGVAVRLTSF